MSKIDTKQWKEFKVGDLFVVSRGKRFVVGKHIIGNIPYYSASLENNGITDFISNPIFTDSNAIVVTTFGDAFFADGIFTASDEITILHNENLNKYNGLFIATSITANKRKYSFKIKAFLNRVLNDFIKLPVDNKGNPDREYMEIYMKNLEGKCKKSLEELKLARKIDDNKINTNEWKEFKVGDLFDIHPTKAYKAINNDLFDDDGINPVIVNSGFNNGIGGYTNKDCTEKAGIITFTDTAAKSSESFFYHDNDFVGYPHVQGMYTKGHGWNKRESLFLISVIKSTIKGNYDFIKKMTRDEISKLSIKLPIDNEGNPNREYMENYMKNLMEKNKEKLNCLN